MRSRSRAELPRLRERGDPGALLAGLIKAALADEAGEALDRAIADLGAASAARPLPPLAALLPS